MTWPADYTEIACGAERCGWASFFVPTVIYDRWRRTHETWWCPSGHARAYLGKTKEERELEQLRERARRCELEEVELEQAIDEAKRRCPWPTCEGRVLASEFGLRQHLVKTHGAPWRPAELEQGAAAS